MITTRFALRLAPLALVAAACDGAHHGEQRATPGAVPAAILAAEGLAEDVQADLDALDWRSARATLGRLQVNRAALGSALTGDGRSSTADDRLARYDAALDSLRARIGREERLGALQTANRMSRLVLGITENYEAPVPFQVGYPDVAGRDAIYAAESGDWHAAAAAAAELRVNHATVQAHVASRDAVLAQRLARRLRALNGAVAAHDSAQVRRTATGLLDDVDLVERTY